MLLERLSVQDPRLAFLGGRPSMGKTVITDIANVLIFHLH